MKYVRTGADLYQLRHAFNESCNRVEWLESQIKNVLSVRDALGDDETISLNYNKVDIEIGVVASRTLFDEKINQLKKEIRREYETMENVMGITRTGI